MNQESPAPRRRSNFQAPGTVDAEALTRLFGDAATADLTAAARPASPDPGPEPAVSGPSAVAAAASRNDAAETPSGRRASARPVDEPAPRRRASRRGNRRATPDAAPAAGAADRAPSSEGHDAVAQHSTAHVEPAAVESASAEFASAEFALVESALVEPAPTESASTESPPTESAWEAVASPFAERPLPAESADEAADPMTVIFETALTDAELVETGLIEATESDAVSAEPGHAEPVPAAAALDATVEPARAEHVPGPAALDVPVEPAPVESARTASAVYGDSPVQRSVGEHTKPVTVLLDPVLAEPESQPATALASAESAPRTRAAASTGSRTQGASAFAWNLTPEAPSPVDRVRSSSPGAKRPRRPRHRLVVGASAAALLVVTGLGALAVVNDVPASLFAASGEGSPAPSDALAGASAPTITSGLSATAAPFTGGTSITVTGERLDEVAQVSVAGVPADILEASGDRLTFAVPATTGDAIGAAEVVFADGEGRPVTVAVAGTDASASAEASAGAASEPEDPSEASAPAADAAAGSLTLTYTTDPGIDAQLAYVLEYWDDYNTAEYPAVPGKDAVNFASQSLIARGWTMDDAWNVDPATGAMSTAWSSSTALREYLLTRADRATELTDAQRDQVKVGDLAQFDWDDSGDRDHTAVVTRVERTDAGTKVWVASHTKDADYWDVDAALASGGAVSWFSIR